MKNRFSSLQIKNLNLKNRVVVPPMASSTADENGFVTKKTIEHYKKLSQSGAALVFVEYSYVDLSGRSEPNQLAIDHEDKIQGLVKLAQTIKINGPLAGVQLTHSGGKTSTKVTDGNMWAPSTIPTPVLNAKLETPQEMPKEMISNFVQSFVDSAKLAYISGFDIVEIHCAHGYGINQWLSPLTNQRQDEYGGSLHSRAKVLYEIVKGIRKEVPEIVIAARIPGQDLLEGGLSVSDVKIIAQKLESLGVGILDVSSGLGGWRRPKDRRGQGYLIPEAREIQKSVQTPVIGVGGIQEASYIDELIAKRTVSLAAVGRAILDSPLNWKKNIMSSHHNETI